MALAMHPPRDVLVPLVTCIRDAADGRLDGLPPLLVIERTTDGLRDEAASPSRTYSGIETFDVLLVQGNVHTHGHTLAHWLAHGRP